MTVPTATSDPLDPLDPRQAHAIVQAAAVSSPGAKILPVRTPHGPGIVKFHQDRQRWHNEVGAYRAWVPAVQAGAPLLLGTSTDPPALILSLVHGPRLDHTELNPCREREVFHALGTYLKAFHASAPPRLDPGFTAWLGERGLQWLNLARDLLDARERHTVREHLQALAALTVEHTVPCHLDFTPSNVIVGEAGPVVIDYEHARHDLAGRDLARLHDRVWSRRPDLREAFLDAYGPLDRTDEELLTHAVTLDRLTRRVRAHRRRLPTPGPARQTDRPASNAATTIPPTSFL